MHSQLTKVTDKLWLQSGCPSSSQESVAWVLWHGFSLGLAVVTWLAHRRRRMESLGRPLLSILAVSSDRPAPSNHPRPHGDLMAYSHSLAGPPESTTPVPGSSGGLTGLSGMLSRFPFSANQKPHKLASLSS
ncbi:hypothetical protein V8C40DRAFT_249931 [Trichoderma camerunense]